MALLRRYVDFASQEAFSELVGRHLTWVYSTCYKALRDREMAEDASQAVFIILARRASTITPQTRISGWLFNTARFVVKDARKQQARYRRREEIARELASERMVVRPPSVDTEMQSSLDDAMAFIKQNPDEARRILAQYTKLPEAVVKATPFPTYRTAITAKDIEVWANVLREVGQLTTTVDPQKLVAH